MREKEVPQDDDPQIYQDKFGDGMIKYATNEDNQYVAVQSAGWEPEIVALKQAWEEVDRKLEEARLKVLAGELSPIGYYIEKKLMDVGILAGYAGKWKWQVKRHLKPVNFNKLSPAMLQKYADIFGISVDELCHIK